MNYRDFIPIELIGVIIQHVIIFLLILAAGQLIFLFIEKFIGDWLSKDVVHTFENITTIFLIGWRAVILIWEITKRDFSRIRSLMFTYVP